MKIICFLLSGLGFFIMVIGLFAACMYMFGFKKTQPGGKSKLGFEALGIDLEMETGSFFFAIIIGLIMIISPFAINEIFLYGDHANVHAADKNTQYTSKSEEGGYKISEEDVRINLRDRKEIGLDEYFAGDLSGTERLVRIVIKDVKNDVKEVNFRHATSGYSIKPIEKPEGGMWRKIKKESKEEIHNPFFNLLKGQGIQKILRDLFARKGRMRSYYMTVPITDGVGQEIVYKLKYYNSFQGKDFEWAGKVFSADTDVLTMRIAFPEEKPFKSYEAYKKAAGAEEKNRIESPDIKAEGNKALAWTIWDAKKGEKYFIKWTW